MSSNSARSLLILSVMAAALKTPARGAMIEFTFEGAIQQAFREGVEPWGLPAPGTPVSFRYVFDDGVLDQDPNLAVGNYEVVSGSFIVGGKPVPVLGGYIRVADAGCKGLGCNPNLVGGYDVFGDLGNGVVAQVSIGFNYSPGPMGLLPTDLDLSLAIKGPHLSVGAPNGGMVGFMSDFSRQVVPEPGAGVLLALTLIRLCTRRSIAARATGSSPKPPTRAP